MPPQATTNDSKAISHFEIARLASLNWQKDGCPQGRDLDYWLAAERELKATPSLAAVGVKTPPKSGAETKPAKSKPSRKPSARLDSV